MRSRRSIWILSGLLLLAGAWFFGRDGALRRSHKEVTPAVRSHLMPSFTTSRSASTAPQFLAGKISTNTVQAAAKTNQFPWRLSNTKKSISELTGDRHAILLENALIDTGVKLDLAIPKNLQASGDPGAYIVQARGPIDAVFRAQLAAAGAQIVSYIPNDAYLVRVSAGGANELAALPLTQSVIPYEPYYKLTASLLNAIAKNEPVSELKVAAYPDTADQARAMLEKAGMTVSATGSSPFGPVFTVQNVSDVAAVARMSVLQLVEPVRQRIHANDLSRQTTGVSLDSVTTTNYLNLSGSNVMVEVNDTGIDATHPDFDDGGGGPVRVVSDDPANLVDTDGHGTFVAGEIAGDGFESTTVTNAQGSINPGVPGQYRGKAPLATLFSMNFEDSDQELQAAAALTNALISNNSWNFDGDNTYDLEAASYDAAVRDALPLVTGSQPVLFVFSAGNNGNGDSSGGGGDPDTILSPATAKNVITVGALEEQRNITNIVTDLNGNSNAVWKPETDDSSEVAFYSSRGNVGIGTEGASGRYKPDVVAPGSFVVSTRSQEWDEEAYYNPTNNNITVFPDFLNPNSSSDPNAVEFFVFANAAVVTIQVLPIANATSPLPDMPIYVWEGTNPNTTPGTLVGTNSASIPAVPNGTGWSCSVSNTSGSVVDYDLVVDVQTTNDLGNYFEVLSNLNDSIGTSPFYYRYESGTSMAAADTSGVLALMQDFFTNTLHTMPSPALMKAMLINGARPTGTYNFDTTPAINFEGWGLINLPNSLPLTITNLVTNPGSTSNSIFFLDESPTNALATGDSQTFIVTVDTNSLSATLSLRVTLAWTDPPGNPAAAIKLVNNLDLMVTNLDTGDVFFGNDISSGNIFNSAWNTNLPPNLDVINNIENVFLSQPLAGNYSVTIVGRDVNVNAVTAQTNNVVQDYALVITCGDSADGGAITVTPGTPAFVSNPTSDQQITIVGVNTNGMATNSSTTGGIFLNQLAGANTPLLGTNTVDAISNYTGNAVVTLGMTNQWHFYVVQNNTDFTNAAFITFLPDTLAIPRMGVFAGSDANSTQPEADIDLYVSTDPSLTNLNPVVISNCVNGTQVGVSVPGAPPIFNGASLGRGGTEFVADTGSQPNQVYYVGVKSETAEAAEYGFLPVFSQQPFSQTQNGIETVNGLLLPTSIPDGSPAHPGTAYIFALAVQPIEVQDVIVSNQIVHENFGDLIGTFSHSGKAAVLNNHDSPDTPLPPGPYNFTYDNSPAPIAGSQPPDGPGSLQDFQGQQGIGPWILTEVDDSLTKTGAVTGLTLTITPHQDLKQGINVAIAGHSYFFGFIDVPVGATNLTLSATNISGTTLDPNHLILDAGNPGQLFEKLGEQPVPPPTIPTNFDQMVILNNPGPLGPGGSIIVDRSDSPPLQPGRYFVTLYNPSPASQQYFIIATLGVGQVAPVDFSSDGPVPLLDDAVTYSFITNNFTADGTNETIAAINVGIRVDHPRISDLVFHLISPDGTRFLLMENRGGTSTNGAGATIFSTNAIANFAANGANNSVTNFVSVSQSSGTLPISWDFFPIPDEMTVYNNTNGNYGPANQIFDTGLVPGPGQTNLSFTTTDNGLAIIMNQFSTPTNGDAWTYTAGGVSTNYLYLTFTEDTNLTTIPIKFAPPPFVPPGSSNLFYLPEQDISPLIGTSAYGLWQLEIQDDRVGATNNTVLDSWQLQFVFANTNIVPSIPVTPPIGTGPLTNVVPPNSTSWFVVTVPPNADIATNELIFATAPVNLLFNQTAPDTIGDFTLLENSISGSTNLTATTSPPLIPGSTYFLGVQNTNSFPVTNAIEVDFHLITSSPPFAFTEPAQAVTGTNAQLNGMATPNGLPATAWFEWGTNTAYGNQTPSVSVSNSFNVVYVTNSISLTPNVPYHFRLVVSNAFAVVKGFDQILDEANVVVWGANFAGQKFVPAGLSNVVAIAGAYDHSLALKNDETAVVWGDNTFNQTNVPAALNNNLVAVAGGESYSLALKNSGTVIAWGANIFPGETNVPAGLNGVVTIASGQYSSLALQNNGAVVAWGANISGLTNVPAAVNNAVAIAGGSFHNLALINNGTVVAWGDDSIGQTDVPAGLTNVVAISGGSFHSLALKNDGTVTAWGDDTAGQTNVPVGLSNVVAIAAGGFHSLALKNDGTVVAWGDSSAGQTSVPAGLSNVVAIAGGNLHSLALTPLFNVNSTNPIVLSLTNGVPQTNSILPGGITFYQINVPVNADFATNLLLFADEPLNVWFTTNTPPAIVTNASLLLAGVTNSTSILSTTSVPTNIVPGATYYLGVQNTNTITVNYAVEVDFHLLTAPPVFISSIIHTNGGFLLTWFAPSNDLFQVQWNDNLGSTNWTAFTNIVSYNTNFPAGPTNAQFNFFDDGSQTPPGLPPIRFYRLILLQSANPPPASPVSISGITSTNVSGTNGFLLTWFAPTNDLFQVQWSTNLASTNWGTFTNIIAYDLFIGPTNSQFNFLDDGSQTGGTLGPVRFYRLILLQANSSLTLPVQTNFTASPSTTMTVTNTAVDSRFGAILAYNLTNSPAGATISSNGIITWTNVMPSGLAARFTTIVTDNGSPSLTASNTFTVFVTPLPSITNVTVTATNLVLNWSAPTNDQFQVQWTTNLTPVIIWTPFPNVITSTNGLFSFTDTNAPLLMKFYQLILLP